MGQGERWAAGGGEGVCGGPRGGVERVSGGPGGGRGSGGSYVLTVWAGGGALTVWMQEIPGGPTPATSPPDPHLMDTPLPGQ